jgi:hypothetical protein
MSGYAWEIIVKGGSDCQEKTIDSRFLGVLIYYLLSST